MSNFFGKPIKHQIYIAAAPEKVYDTITSGDEWNRFFTHSTEVDPHPGGRIVFRWKDWGPNFYTTSAEGKVLEIKKPTRFVFQWYPVTRDNPTKIEFDLSEQHGGTIVDLHESGYPDTPESRAMILECASGWGEALTLLKFYIEHGVTYTPPKK